LKERQIEAEDVEKIKVLMDQSVNSFVTVQLNQYFKTLIGFVSSVQDGNTPNKSKCIYVFQVDLLISVVIWLWSKLDDVIEVAKGFASSYQANLKSIWQEVISCFSNLRCGANFLEQLFNSLAMHYSRFEEIVHAQFNEPAVLREVTVTSKKLTKDMQNYRIEI
jgi:phage-related protein